MQDSTTNSTTTDLTPQVTDATFAAEVESPNAGFVLVDFWAVWCTPCRMLEPHVKAVAEKTVGKLHVRKLNVDENRATAMKYNIMGIPTMLLFSNGQLVAQSVGFKPADSLLAWLKEKGVAVE